MAFTIRQGFEELKRNLEITQIQSTTVSERQNRVRSVIGSAMSVRDSFLAGSYVRNTLIAPLKEADVDIFIVLDGKYAGNNPTNLLDLVKRNIDQHYPRTSRISRNGQAVTIFFSDFTVDVVPGIENSIGDYMIPDSYTKSWIVTNPKKHIILWREKNAQLNGKFIPLIKMVKGWNKAHGELFQSFHLESLILSILNYVPLEGTHSLDLSRIFNQLNGRNDYSIQDPAGFSSNVGGYISRTKTLSQIKDQIKRTSEIINIAVLLEGQGDISTAFLCWQSVFGGNFPKYG